MESIKKILAAGLAMIFMLTLTACEVKIGGDTPPNSGESANNDIPTSGGEVTPAPEPSTPSQISSPLIGEWFEGDSFGGYYDSSGAYVGDAGNGAMWIFNNDGTYSRLLGTSSWGTTYINTHQGNYSVSGDTISCFNNTWSETENGKLSSPWAAGEDYSFQFRVGSDEYGEYFVTTVGGLSLDETVKYRRVE